MFTCKLCGHDEMVHFFFAGCCIVNGCPCEGMDGSDTCRSSNHGEACWSLTARLSKPPVTRQLSDQIFTRSAAGVGTRPLSREFQLKRPLIMQILHEQWWPRPAGLPERQPTI